MVGDSFFEKNIDTRTRLFCRSVKFTVLNLA